TEAAASLDFRLVPDQTPEGVRGQVEEHLRGLGFFVVHGEPDAATRLAHGKVARLDWDEGYPGARPFVPARPAPPAPAARGGGGGGARRGGGGVPPGARTAMDLPVSRAVV